MDNCGRGFDFGIWRQDAGVFCAALAGCDRFFFLVDVPGICFLVICFLSSDSAQGHNHHEDKIPFHKIKPSLLYFFY